MKQNVFRSAVATLAVALVSIGACDRSPVDPPGHAALGTVAIIDRAAVPQAVLATWTHNGGWQPTTLGSVSHAAEDHRTRKVLGVRMWTQGGQEIQLVEDGEYEARYGVHADPQNVVDMASANERFHGDHVYVFGYNEERRTGTAQLVFVLWHDGHSDGQTDPIGLTFTD
jgi:hypothetical protein